MQLAQVLNVPLEQLTETPQPFEPKMEAPSAREIAQQLCALNRADAQTKRAALRKKARQRIAHSLLFALGAIAVYIIGRLLVVDIKNSTLIGLLFTAKCSGYLFGWLLSSKLYWIVMAACVILSLLGRRIAALTLFSVSVLAIPIGELLGPYPPGEAYGHGHYGWAIWLGAVLFGAALGIILEVLLKKRSKCGTEVK